MRLIDQPGKGWSGGDSVWMGTLLLSDEPKKCWPGDDYVWMNTLLLLDKPSARPLRPSGRFGPSGRTQTNETRENHGDLKVLCLTDEILRQKSIFFKADEVNF